MNASASLEIAAPIAGRRWLVVDDECDLAEIIADLLTPMNADGIESYSSPIDALQSLFSQPEDIELLITDRDMPGLDGLELARQFRKEAPRAKILLVSARIKDLSAAELREAGIDHVLQKPFSIGKLESLVRKVVFDSRTSAVRCRLLALPSAA